MGIGVLPIFLIYCAIAVLVTHFVPARIKIISIIIFILIPTWDILPKLFYFNYLCSNSSGIEIFEKPKSKGFYYDKEQKELGYLQKQAGNFTSEFKNDDNSVGYSSPELSSFIIKNSARESFYDHGVFIETWWKESLIKKFGRFWVDIPGAEHCLSGIKKEELIKWCGIDCAKEDACIAGIEIENRISPYIYKPYDRHRSRNNKFGSTELLSQIIRGKDGFIMANAKAYIFHGGWVQNILGFYQNCETPIFTKLNRLLLYQFFDSSTTELTRPNQSLKFDANLR